MLYKCRHPTCLTAENWFCNTPWVCGCVSAALCTDSPVCCEPGWPCCVRSSGCPSLGPQDSASSEALLFVSACCDALPAAAKKINPIQSDFILKTVFHWHKMNPAWREKLTSSAYFLQSPPSFSSGVLRVFSVCMRRVISFPAQWEN